MSNDLVFVILVAAALIDWFVASVLIRATVSFPSVEALRERAFLALVIAIAVSVYIIAAWNIDFGHWWDDAMSRSIARVCVGAIGLVPLYWLWLFKRGRFGNDRKK